MARRRRKEHEAHQIGTGIERRIERDRIRQATDFDQHGHAGFRISITSTPALEHFAEKWSPQAAGGGMTRRGRASAAGLPLGSRPAWARSAPSCASALRVRARHLACRSQAAQPPSTTPPIEKAKTSKYMGCEST